MPLKILQNKIKGKKTIAENFIYISFLQLFLIIAPLITYPYLVRVIGAELYGVVVTAQVLVSYFSIVIDFGSNSISARYIALNQCDNNALSQILSSILSARFFFWIICTFVYVLIVFSIPSFCVQWPIFLLMYGITFHDLLFPQFFFQGMEKMKFITFVNITVKLLFILLIFAFVKTIDDYILVPIFYSVGYLAGGLLSLLIIKKQFNISISLKRPKDFWYYVKDCSPLLAKELISTIKDKMNFFLVGKFIGMHDVTVYDLCFKFVSMASKPVNILGTVLLPHFAKHSNRKKQKIVLVFSILLSLVIIGVTNIFLDRIVFFFLHETIDLLPVRLMLIAPLFLAVSQSIGYNYIIANGLNKHILWSILVATVVYCMSLLAVLISGIAGELLSFVFIVLLSYFSEMCYRVWVFMSRKGESERVEV